MIYAVGADSGASAAWALVSLEKGKLGQLVALEGVYGSRTDLWIDRARAGAERMHSLAPTATWWVERPMARINRAAGMAHHNVGVGLGERIGMLRTEAYRVTGRCPELCEPGAHSPEKIALDQQRPPARREFSGRPQWWFYFFPLLKLRPKSDPDHGDGIERVAEASTAVLGAREALALVPESRRVDAAESILIACACALHVARTKGWGA